MLLREGDTRSSEIDRRLACALAMIAGALNSAGFYAVGFFSSNMTGNVSTLADRLALGDLLTGATYLAIVATFILGAAASTLLINAGRRRGVTKVYVFSILAEAVLLGLLGCVDLWLGPGRRGPLLIFGLSFLMGLQNAVVTRISNARVRTTHVSGMSTDIGIELGCLADIAVHRGSRAEAAPFLEKLRLHGSTVLSFCVGGIVGVLAYKAFGAALLFAAAGLLFLIALPGIVARRQPKPSGLAGGEGGA
jgi:uncharacterized membrane protein YoaK (UPF0700 family)